MNTSLAALAVVIATLGTSALAQDVAKGESEFRKCKACHSITAADGTAIQKGGKTGPDLFGVVGRAVAAYPDFNYGDGILAAGANGLIWDAAMLADYLKDPGVWVKAASGDPAARSKMTFKLAKGGADIAAYLVSLAPLTDDETEGDDEGEEDEDGAEPAEGTGG